MIKKYIVVVLLIFGSILCAQDYEIGDNELFIMPTAKTIPQGTGYLADYELIFLNCTLGITNRTNISTYFLFPVTYEVSQVFVLSAKQNYYQNKNLSAAAWVIHIVDSQISVIGNVISTGTAETSLHAGMATTLNKFDINKDYLYMLGFKQKLRKGMDFIIEYENTNSGFEYDFPGFCTAGFRFKSRILALDIAGVRPMTMGNVGLLWIPYVKATVFFGGNNKE